MVSFPYMAIGKQSAIGDKVFSNTIPWPGPILARLESILFFFQEQDTFGGGLDPKQSFSGHIAQFNMFSRCENCNV